MPDLLNVQYAQTGASTKQNSLGMREMQARAYEKRNSQYLLLKAPPASGKSRALMFLALDKVQNQGLDKVLIAVPEMAIGASFRDTDLKSHGFFADWRVRPKYSLCTPGGDAGKVDAVVDDIVIHLLVLDAGLGQRLHALGLIDLDLDQALLDAVGVHRRPDGGLALHVEGVELRVCHFRSAHPEPADRLAVERSAGDVHELDLLAVRQRDRTGFLAVKRFQ